MLIPVGALLFGSKKGSKTLVSALPKPLPTGSFGKDAVAFLSSG
jgi:hypothetical protein